MAIQEKSFRFGCGRYIQEAGAFGLVGEEVSRFGRSAWIVGGKTALSVASDAVLGSLERSGVTYALTCHGGSCNLEDAKRYGALAAEYDVVIGIGGGVIMDLAKLVAHEAGKPVLNLPTSAATCAAFTPLSVCYTKEGKTVGTVHFSREIDGVIVDTECMVHQPPRLLLAGIFDAMAKLPEILHRYREDDPDMALGLDYAYHLSGRTYAFLVEHTDEALECLRTGTVTPIFERMIFSAVAVTGMVSSIARGSNQTALAHKFYEKARKLDTATVASYLHGEMVGVGLLLQHLYNGTEEENIPLRAWMARYGLPDSPSALGIASDGATVAGYEQEIIHSSAMADGGDLDRLHRSLTEFWKL